MDRRAFARLALLMVVAGCSAGERKYAPLTRGAALPAEWLPEASADGPGVVWIFRTDDCLTCESLDYSLRRLQRAHPEVPLSTIHVGRLDDAGIPRAFLADRRISAAANVDIPPKQFRRIYGEITLPALVIRNGDRITWSSIGSRSGLGRATIDSLFTGQITAANLPVTAAPGGSSARHRQE
jgi:hypothetical protein